MENVAFVDPVAGAAAISQIVATNVHPVIAGSFHFVPMSKAGNEVQDALSEHRAAPASAEDKLDLLADLRFAADTVAHAKQTFIDNILSSVHHKLDAYDSDVNALRAEADRVETEVRNAALSLGSTIKGHRLQAVWGKGRTSWDGKLLEGYAIAFPEILKAQKIGEPSVSIRVVGGAK